MGFLKPLDPVFYEKVWGATRLEPWFPNSDKKIGEVWFSEPDSPVLIKFLFTSAYLSVQVHPDDVYAAKYENCSGKTEMWRILRADPGAQIALGFERPPSESELRASIADGSIMGLLRWIPVQAGDTWFVPAGAVHAIGAGLALCEIQQNSDITYRLYDYGRPRELHIEQSLATLAAGFVPDAISREAQVVADCPYFRTEVLRTGSRVIEDHAGRARILIGLKGSATIGERTISLGQTWRLADGDVEVRIEGELLYVSYQNLSGPSAGE